MYLIGSLLYVSCQMTIGPPVCVRKLATHYYFLNEWVNFFLCMCTARVYVRAYIDTRELFLCCILPFPTIKA